MNIKTLVLGDYGTNCYIVWAKGQHSCAVIDPGYEPETVLEEVNGLGLSVEAILLTHGHFDHVGGVERIVESTGCKLWMSESDWSQPMNPLLTHYFPLANCDFTEVCFCEDGEAIPAGGLTFTVWETPGHTQGSVCFFCGDALFSGDTLFAGSCGRTDLPGGDWNTILNSLGRLAQVEKELTVFPGHGPATALAWEKRTNPYMK